ncbi:MAG: helix-turn-helix domain-containing protein [Gemmobacter sp.]|uniref:helix-turn-helix domain-containing protein n=1 Tax=Gemmobacter sp. TaxID=1898957 RepID=UPI00391B7DF6
MTKSATEYLTVEQAAEFLTVHRQTIHTYVRKGLLPASKLGRRTLIHPDDLRALLRPVVNRATPGGLAGGLKATVRIGPLI